MDISIGVNNVLAATITSSIEVELYDKIDKVSAADWLRFVPDANPLLNPTYLRLIEETQKGEMEFIYALIRNADGLLGVCYFQIVRFRGINLIPYFAHVEAKGWWGRWVNKLMNIAKGWVAKIDIPIVVSGNLFITGEQGLFFLAPITELEKSYYLAYTIQYIFKQRSDIKAVLLPDMYEPSGDFDSAFQQQQYRRIYVESDMSMQLPTQWQSFNDYLAAISSKYRVRAKKVIQTSSSISHWEMDSNEINMQQDRLYELYRAVADKADFNIAKFTKDYFNKQKALAPDLYKVFGYYLDGELVGFMSLFILPYKTEVHYCGIDYSINKDYALYQRMLYDIVDYAATHHLRKLHFGRTAPEVKSTIGAIPQPMYGYVKYRNPIINSFIGIFTSRLKPRNYTLRSPFK